MFAPVGRKKILLKIQRAGEDKEKIQQILQDYEDKARKASVSPPRSRSRSRSRSPGRGSTTPLQNSTIPRRQLEEMLELSDPTAKVLTRIMEAAARYRPERDAVSLKAFNSQRLPYKLFRTHLHNVLGVTLSDYSFKLAKQIFDMNRQRSVNGYDFIVTFHSLGAIAKDKFMKELKEKEMKVEKIVKKKEERKLLLEEKRLESDIDFEINDEVNRSAISKLKVAAKAYDPGSPLALNLDGFAAAMLKPNLFRDVLKRSFNLLLTPKELGAVVKTFSPECDGKLIPAGEFIRYFYSMGFSLRDKEIKDQRSRQRELNLKAEAERRAKQEEADNKGKLKIDMDYSEADAARANEKLLLAAAKYEKGAPSSLGLEGFVAIALPAAEFREVVRRTFNLNLRPKELGAVIRKFQSAENPGMVDSHLFLLKFLQMGIDERQKVKLRSLHRQKEAEERMKKEHEEKLKEADLKMVLNITAESNKDIEAATLEKFKQAAAKYEKGHPSSVGLEGFDAAYLVPAQFREIVKRTFNLKLNMEELAAAMKLFDKENNGHIQSAEFLVTFFKLGAEERAKFKSEALEKQRMMNEEAAAEAERKVKEEEASRRFKADFDFTDIDRETALHRMTEAASKYDRTSSSALDLSAFEVARMEGGQFRELLKRIFNLTLKPKELGALICEFDKDGSGVDSKEFTRVFLKIGVDERAKWQLNQLKKQRRMDKERVEEEKRRVEEAHSKAKKSIQATFSGDDLKSALEKVKTASVAFDKNHPGAPSLVAFDVHHLAADVFREVLKQTFNIILSSGELVALIRHIHPNSQDENVNSKDFLILFNKIGFQERGRIRKEALEKQRKENLEQKLEAEQKVAALVDKAEFKMEWEYTSYDFDCAMEIIAVAAKKFDKSSSSAPNVDALDCGTMKPGVFREMLRRTFGISFTVPQLAAAAKQFDNGSGLVNTHDFMLFFMKMGAELREKERQKHADNQKQFAEKVEKERLRKKKIADQKLELDLGEILFFAEDKRLAIEKLTEASAKYDSNGPGAVPLTAFDAAYLTPLEFREVLKRTFSLAFVPRQFAALVDMFKDKNGNVKSKDFVVKFIQLGVDARSTFKLTQLEKLRKAEKLRKEEEELKRRQAEAKMLLNIDFSKSVDSEKTAFAKLTEAAKRYDKNNPGSMALDAFDCSYMDATTFREMLARTFNVRLSIDELSSIMRFFDPDLTGKVPCQEFINHFLKTGFSERRKVLQASLKKCRDAEKARIAEDEAKLAAQWAKMELDVTYDYTKEEQDNAMAKLAEAARWFDHSTSNLSAFDGNYMSPAIFREMLKRLFNIKLSGKELGSLVDHFDSDKSRRIDCTMFVVKFTSLGFTEREKIHEEQVHRKHLALEREKKELYARLKAGDARLPKADIDFDFDQADFNSAMEKIRVEASKYDHNHPSAPDLRGFQGSNLAPAEFKDQLRKAFNMNVTAKELAALVKYFDTSASGNVDAVDFLLQFSKINRLERSKRHREHIELERSALRREKDEEEKRESKKHAEDARKLTFIKADEESLLNKIRTVGQNFAVDSASMIEPLQSFKGPALTPSAFREVFYRVFHIKLTYPELGVLLSIYDDPGIGSIDGSKFLGSFFRLGRLEEQAMLGQSSRKITLDDLRAHSDSNSPEKKVDSHSKVKMEKFNKASVVNLSRSMTSEKTSVLKSSLSTEEQHALFKKYRINSSSNVLPAVSKTVGFAKTAPSNLFRISSVEARSKPKAVMKPGPNFVLPQLLISGNSERSFSSIDLRETLISPLSMGFSLEDYSTASEFTFGTAKQSSNGSQKSAVKSLREMSQASLLSLTSAGSGSQNQVHPETRMETSSFYFPGLPNGMSSTGDENGQG